MDMQFDPLGMTIDELRDFRKLTGRSVFEVIGGLQDGIANMNEDEMAGLCYLIRRQGPEPVSLEDVGKLTLRQITEITDAFSTALADPKTGSEIPS